MAVQSLIVKLESANQVAQASALVGKTATVHQVATGAGGLATKMVLLPPGGAGAGGTGGLVVKLEGLRQASEVAGLVGQKVTVGTIPSALGKVGGSWLVLKPVGAGAVSSKLTMVAAAATLPAAAAATPAASAAVTPAASAAVTPAASAAVTPAASAAVAPAASAAVAPAAKVAGAGAVKAGAVKTGVAGAVGAKAAPAAVAGGGAVAGKALAAKSALGTSALFSQGGAAGTGLTFAGMAVPFLAGGIVAGAGYLIYQYAINKKRGAGQDDGLDDDDIAAPATA